MEHPLFTGIMDSFKTTIEREGYEMMFITRNLGQKNMTFLEHCRYRGVDGVLILNADPDNTEVLEVIHSGVPCVSANLVYPETTSITSENTQSAIETVRYLYALGHTRIAHIAGPHRDHMTAGLERLKGYRRGLKLCGIPYHQELVVSAEQWTDSCGFKAFCELMQKARPTALFSSSDLLTVGIYQAANSLGLNIPGDLSIVSFDDNEVARYLRPTLTTWRQDRKAIGRMAGEQILRRIAHKTTENRIFIPVELVKRESCEPPRACRRS